MDEYIVKSTYKFKLNSKGTKYGNLVPLEFNTNVPFEIKRIFYIYNVPNDINRGCHAYYETKQVLICIAGRVKIKCFNGQTEEIYDLNNPEEAVYISPKVWRTTFEHSNGAVLLVLSSLEYNEKDYIREYEKFLAVVNCI